MALKRLWRTHTDWILVGVLLTFVFVLSAVIIFYLCSGVGHIPVAHEPLNTYDVPSNSLYDTSPPDSKYPPPAKTQRSFYRTYTERDIQYHVDKLDVNTSHDSAIGQDTFLVNLYNSANKIVTPTDEYLKAITINCIAQDEPYRKIDVPASSLTFAPYETKRVIISTDAQCVYLGSMDGRYFWKIY